jgi:hypothetical protein
VALVFVGLAAPHSADARNLRRTLGEPTESQQGQFLNAALAQVGKQISIQVANQIPTLSTSAGYTYEFNPKLDVYERSAKTFGPLFSERAVTVGKGRFNANVSYTYMKFARYDGHDLHDLTGRVEKGIFGNGDVFAGFTRPDLAARFGRPANEIFSQVNVDLDLEAQLVDLSLTYGLLDDLDVNIDVPVLRTFARSRVVESTLDPRFTDAFGLSGAALERDTFGPKSESAIGLGDVRLRAKYLAWADIVRLAGLLDLVLPTGSPGNFQGTGDTRLGTYAIVSQSIGDVLEPHAQAGVEFNVDDVDRSQAKYLAGFTVQPVSFAAFTIDFIGRSEFAAQGRVANTARLPAVRDEGGEKVFTENPLNPSSPFTGRPFLVGIDRNDVLDLAVGGKVAVHQDTIVFATATLPLNQDGLRADVVPTVGFEMTF